LKSVLSALASVALVAATMGVAVAPAPASAQVYVPTITCEARSPYAYGIWQHVNGNYACKRALEECAARTPYGSVCYVTRWWYS
jgi:hypothetical protein